ncbi:MAG: hypothetical protein F4112_02740 [Holophagales bacterium]|nr:hypothetical protein [Holophagales bacterium]
MRRLKAAAFLLRFGGVFAVAALSWPGTAEAQPRTPWGDPDLQGIWTSATLTPLERPEAMAGRASLSESEASELERTTVESRIAADGTSRPGSVGGYNLIWMDASTRVDADRRTSLIVDPPDGRIPWTAAAREASRVELARYGNGPFLDHTDLDTGERCITDGLPLMVPIQPYNMNFLILQTPDAVVMLHEMYHELRIVPLDNRPRLPETIGLWLGDSRGRWEGDTLVVETTNIADKTDYHWSRLWRAARPTMRLVERFRRIDERTIDYRFTVEDPTMFTAAWTVSAPLTNDQASRGVTVGGLFEFACHEGNRAVTNVLSGAPAEEARAAAED